MSPTAPARRPAQTDAPSDVGAGAIALENAIADVALVRAIAGGDLEALGELFRRHERSVQRTLARLGVPAADVDDLVQATFLEVVKAAPRFDVARPVRAWILGITTMLARRRGRSLGRAARQLASWARTLLVRSDAVPSPADLAERQQAVLRLARAIEALSRKKREVFVLVTLEGMSGEEVALTLGIPINTVWTRLHHARSELRAALEDMRT